MIARYFNELLAYILKTDPEYEDLYQNDLQVYPIPFFGNIQTAKILTVGVNPSNGEFAKHRKWPDSLTRDDLAQRLLEYFSLPHYPPHPWFAKWESALNLIGISYKDGTAAHLDLSPRATKTMSNLKEPSMQARFLKMAEDDIEWFFKVLPLCQNAQLLMVAGAIISHEKKFEYLDEFIQNKAKKHFFELRAASQIFQEGVRFKNLIGGNLDLPVFFCSVSPSAGNRAHLLVERTEKHKNRLSSYLSRESTEQSDPTKILVEENRRLREENSKLKKVIKSLIG